MRTFIVFCWSRHKKLVGIRIPTVILPSLRSTRLVGMALALATSVSSAQWFSQNPPHGLLAVQLTDANTATSVGELGTILRTTNGGAKWENQSSGIMNDLLGVSFTDANTGTAVGDSGTILHTTNGGAIWNSQSSGTTNYLLGVSFTDANTGTVVGGGGTILHTTNGGTIWTSQSSV